MTVLTRLWNALIYVYCWHISNLINSTKTVLYKHVSNYSELRDMNKHSIFKYLVPCQNHGANYVMSLYAYINAIWQVFYSNQFKVYVRRHWDFCHWSVLSGYNWLRQVMPKEWLASTRRVHSVAGMRFFLLQ